jgi:hypothetical protein
MQKLRKNFEIIDIPNEIHSKYFENTILETYCHRDLFGVANCPFE